MRWLICTTVLAASLFAQSPKHPDSARGANSKQDKNSANKDEQSSHGPQPLATNPAKANEKLLTKSNEGAEANRKTADYTEALAHYTLALVIVGGLQIVALIVQGIFLYRAFRETRTATNLTGRSLTEVLRANSANESLIESSNNNARNATELTRQSLLLTHRPRVVVRNVEISDPELLYQSKAGAECDPIIGSIYIASAGATQAHISLVCCDVFRGSLPMVPPYADEKTVNIKLSPGDGITFPFETTPPAATTLAEWIEPRDRNNGVFVLGRVTYRDDIGTIRAAAFCRKFDPASNRFSSVDDPDYEHAE